jgi:RNA polymerase sigma-70 factor (ECF subfamily)
MTARVLPENSVMTEDEEFRDLIRRVRMGDDQAAAQLVSQYEPAIRRSVRYRLTDSRLRRSFDSLDICQTVLGSFFVRAASGQYELESPAQLLKLLATMARNKLAKQVTRQRAVRRDHRRLATEPVEERDVAGRVPTASRQLVARELLDQVHSRLTDEERQLVEWRNQGRDWADIAAETGATPEALRKKLSRALGRVSEELGLGDEDDAV